MFFMNNKVSKKEEEWIRKAYLLKLDLTYEQRKKIDFLIKRMKDCTNKYIEVIIQKVFPNFKKYGKFPFKIDDPNILLENKEILKKEYSRCPLCKGDKKELNFILENFVIEDYTIGKKECKRVIFKEGSKINVCDCFSGNSSNSHKIMRMFVNKTKNRKPIDEFDVIKMVEPLPKRSYYDACLQKAMETIKSKTEKNKENYKKIKYLEERIKHNKEWINGKVKDKELNKYNNSPNKIKSWRKKDNKLIEKLKRKTTGKVSYHNDTARLYSSDYTIKKGENDYIIKLRDPENQKVWMNIKFFGENYQKKVIENQKNKKETETEIMRKENGDYYLCYIIKKKFDKIDINENMTAIGIDLGITNIMCTTSMKKDLKPFDVSIINGKKLINKRMKFAKIRRIWGTKKRIDKIKQSKNKERRYGKDVIHWHTTKLINKIKEYENPVIVMENLINISDYINKAKKISKSDINKLNINKKRKARRFRKLNYMLSSWNRGMVKNYFEYKAQHCNIPIVYIPPKDTSKMCSKCGYKDWKNRISRNIFKCQNCGSMYNADVNASINIAKRFFELIKTNKFKIMTKTKEDNKKIEEYKCELNDKGRGMFYFKLKQENENENKRRIKKRSLGRI